jgi:hypothetical protein
MTFDQYISAGASVGAFLAAFATFLTVWQIAKQRRATYRPDIVVMRARVITTDELNDESIAPLLKWKRSEEEADRDDFFGNDYPLLLVNIGMGAATSVSTKWGFPMESFISATRRIAQERGLPEEIEFRNNGGVSHVRPQITSFWRNQQDGYFDYLLPASIDHKPIRLDLPSAYILAVAAHMSLFLKVFGEEDSKAPQVPPLELSLEFNDIAGQRHRTSYEIEFHWYAVTPHAFEAELVPKRV